VLWCLHTGKDIGKIATKITVIPINVFIIIGSFKVGSLFPDGNFFENWNNAAANKTNHLQKT
jgi:hypothetical protein